MIVYSKVNFDIAVYDKATGTLWTTNIDGTNNTQLTFNNFNYQNLIYMKQRNYLLLLIVLLCTSTITFAQTNPENQIIVYFTSGVQKNEVDKSKFTITSANVSRIPLSGESHSQY